MTERPGVSIAPGAAAGVTRVNDAGRVVVTRAPFGDIAAHCGQGEWTSDFRAARLQFGDHRRSGERRVRGRLAGNCDGLASVEPRLHCCRFLNQRHRHELFLQFARGGVVEPHHAVEPAGWRPRCCPG